MRILKWLTLSVYLAAALRAATFGTPVALLGGASDLVLDESRGRLYLVNTTAARVEVYSISQRRFLSPVKTDGQPVSAALSRSRRLLYVTSYDAAALDVIDLDRLVVTARISLPAKPEGVAVGADERVLITTIGSGTNNQSNTLLIYDPSITAGNSINNVLMPVPPPLPPQLPAPSGRVFLAYRSRLAATRAGDLIVGVNNTSASSQTVFVYEVASGSVLRSRAVTSLSSVLSVAPDGSKFMAGFSLFDVATLSVLAQQNAANSPFYVSTGVSPASQFNSQTNQGGSVFTPDGSMLYSAFNVAPVQNPAAKANVSRLLLSDPDNLLINMGIQLPENLVGKMVITSDGGTLYALSESGFISLPVAALSRSAIASADSTVLLLANDQCGLSAKERSASMSVRNAGAGRMAVSVQLLQSSGAGGAIVVPPIGGGGGVIIPGTGTAQAQAQTAPAVSVLQGGTAATVTFRFNSAAARSPGTVTPHDFLVQSSEAVNIPANLRVYQNNRDTETRGTVLPVAVNTSFTDGLVDMVHDVTRQRLYLANSGMNRVEVFDMRRQAFLAPIKVGQLPRSMALSVDGMYLYVANTGGESISIVDLDKSQVTGRVKFPPIPFNAGFALVTPTAIASGLRGPQVVMSDGTLWRIAGGDAVPRTLSPAVFGVNARQVSAGNPAVRTLAAAPGGEYILLFTGAGYAYLYDAGADEWVAGRQILTTAAASTLPGLTGYVGPVAAGPGGQYYVVDGVVLNSALTPVSSLPGTAPGGFPGTGGATSADRPVAAVAAVSARSFARFSQPVRTAATAVVSDAPTVDIVDTETGATLRSATAREGPLSTVTGTQRIAANARTMAVDAAGTSAYILTTSGLSVVPLDIVPSADRPQISGGVVNSASGGAALAPGSLASVYGRNLGSDATADATHTLPTLLGGVCVTMDNTPLPLLMTSAGQVNLQIPPGTSTTGRRSIVVRNIDRMAASPAYSAAISKYAPAVFVSPGGQPAIFHQDGRAVSQEEPARRDEPLSIFANGLGATKGGKVTSGEPSPFSPLAVTEKVQVYFGDYRYKQSAVIVDWSGLAPGIIGIYQINVRVPGFHMKGDALPVMLKIGGASSPLTGAYAPKVAVE